MTDQEIVDQIKGHINEIQKIASAADDDGLKIMIFSNEGRGSAFTPAIGELCVSGERRVQGR